MIRHKIRDYTSIKTEKEIERERERKSSSFMSFVGTKTIHNRFNNLLNWIWWKRLATGAPNNQNTRLTQRHIYKGDIFISWSDFLDFCSHCSPCYTYMYVTRIECMWRIYCGSLCSRNLSLIRSTVQNLMLRVVRPFFDFEFLGFFAIRFILILISVFYFHQFVVNAHLFLFCLIVSFFSARAAVANYVCLVVKAFRFCCFDVAPVVIAEVHLNNEKGALGVTLHFSHSFLWNSFQTGPDARKLRWKPKSITYCVSKRCDSTEMKKRTKTRKSILQFFIAFFEMAWRPTRNGSNFKASPIIFVVRMKNVEADRE